jgi:hypothetical protein
MKLRLFVSVLLLLGVASPVFAAPSGYTDGCYMRGSQKICPLK